GRCRRATTLGNVSRRAPGDADRSCRRGGTALSGSSSPCGSSSAPRPMTEGRRARMRAERHDDEVSVRMSNEEAQNLLREIDKWPELPQVERDLVDALKQLPRT